MTFCSWEYDTNRNGERRTSACVRAGQAEGKLLINKSRRSCSSASNERNATPNPNGLTHRTSATSTAIGGWLSPGWSVKLKYWPAWISTLLAIRHPFTERL